MVHLDIVTHGEFSRARHNKDQNDLKVVVAAVEEVEDDIVEVVEVGSKEEVVEEEDEVVEEVVEEDPEGVIKDHLSCWKIHFVSNA
jgi:hypothetical protein